MARVGPNDIKAILDTDLTDSQIEAFIFGATEFVDKILTGSGLNTVLLKEIERFLTAHLIAATREQQPIKEGAGGASITYQGVTGEGLKSTFYGQHVLLLDTTNKIYNNTMRRSASITAVESFDD